MIRRWARPGRGQRGLALIIVLWVTALMVVLAAGFGFSLRTETRLASGAVDRARAGAAAEAVLRRALVDLVEQFSDSAVSTSNEWSLEYAGVAVQAKALPENSRIDLNTGPEPLIEALLDSVSERLPELDAQRAGAIAAAILDWRDTDDRPRDDGAEARDYAADGRDGGPRDQAFLSVSELTQVRGMDRKVYEALAPLVTVYSWSPQVDPMYASRETLLAIPGLDAQEVDAFILERESGSEAEALTLLQGAERYLARGKSTIYTLTAHARTPSGVRAVRRTVVKLNANPKQPISVLAWFDDAPEAPPAPEPPDPVAPDPD